LTTRSGVKAPHSLPHTSHCHFRGPHYTLAQFEREVIGERIGDKIAASKKKGMWMGGVPPLGYRAQDRKLVIIDSEAEIVRSIFRRYAELGSVGLLKDELEARRIDSRSRPSASGRSSAASRSHAARST
jgi:DNA invertase Pin-like site-specific DNA recombinase